MGRETESSSGENWVRAYEEAPEIFDAFSRAEDPDGLVTGRLAALAELDGRSVLEIGCGTGRLARELAPLARFYVAIEPSAPMIALAGRRCPGDSDVVFLRARGESIPLPPASIEVVVAAWVMAHLRPRLRRSVLRDISRVLVPSPRCGTWLVENHWSGEFQELRGRSRRAEDAEVRPLLEELGFALVETVHTELRFRSAVEAADVLGYLCGERVRKRLQARPRAVLGHHVVILHREAAGSPT